MQTVFSFFENYTDASGAINTLVDHGFDRNEMNAVVERQTARNASEELDGGITGLDALLSGQQPVRVPDLGEVYAAGSLATLLARGSSLPQVDDSGLKTALQEFAVPEPVAEKFTAGVRHGGVLFFLRTADEQAAQAAEVLRSYGGMHVDSHRAP